MNSELKTEGLTALQDELKKHDLKAYEIMDIENPHRVIRALEICRGTGTTYSSFLGKEKNKRKFKTIQIGLTAERSVVYERINKRVDMMMEQGLLDEVKSVAEHRNLNALNTVGYKELFQYLDGNCTLEFAVEEIKRTQGDLPKDNSLGLKSKTKPSGLTLAQLLKIFKHTSTQHSNFS